MRVLATTPPPLSPKTVMPTVFQPKAMCSTIGRYEKIETIKKIKKLNTYTLPYSQLIVSQPASPR